MALSLLPYERIAAARALRADAAAGVSFGPGYTEAKADLVVETLRRLGFRG